jgi:polysaccharide deacetylase family protein (PEP-CTERM system associated)
MQTASPKCYLFSIDLEDVRDMVPNGHQFAEAVERTTDQYLHWLDQHNFKATFFVVGRTALAYPALIRKILACGHEIACHSHSHRHLTQMSPEEFKADLERNLEALAQAGASSVVGFRAPTFSLVKSSSWAYSVLAQLGFKYSSSVLPSPNPLFGWGGFGGEKIIDGVYEIPMNIGRYPFKVPFGGGVYFRALPFVALRALFHDTSRQGRPVLGYFHPYDIDTRQERFMHPHLNNNRLLNALMYIGRSDVFRRLDRIIADGFRIISYQQYFESQKGA